MRRAKGAGGYDDFAPGQHGMQCAMLVIGDTGCLPAVQNDFGGNSSCDDVQIGPAPIGGQKGFGGAAAFAVFVGHLILKGAFLGGTIVVRVQREAIGHRCLQKQIIHRALKCLVSHIQAAALAMKGIAELFVMFGAFKQRQQFVIAPAGVAKCGPVVVVAAIAPHIQHRIDGTGTTQCFPPWLIAAATF